LYSFRQKKKFHCGLKELIIERDKFDSAISILERSGNCNLSEVSIFLYENKTLELIDFKNCLLNENDARFLCMGIMVDIKRKDHLNSLRILKLPKNQLRKQGAQILGSCLGKEETVLAELDVSGNNIGVEGGKSFALMIKTNKSLKVLNMFDNSIDVDGARALKEAFKLNCTLEKIDLGCNRLREKGIKELAAGLGFNKNSAIQTLAVKFNFVSDDGFTEFFNMVLFNNTSKLKHFYIKGNNYTKQNLSEIYKGVIEKGILLHVDAFEKLKHFDPSQLERSVWMSPIWSTAQSAVNEIKAFFEEKAKIGIVIDIRIRTGYKLESKREPNVFAIVEFAHPNSVQKALRLSVRNKAVISGKKLKIYRAGTGKPVTFKAKRKHRR